MYVPRQRRVLSVVSLRALLDSPTPGGVGMQRGAPRGRLCSILCPGPGTRRGHCANARAAGYKAALEERRAAAARGAKVERKLEARGHSYAARAEELESAMGPVRVATKRGDIGPWREYTRAQRITVMKDLRDMISCYSTEKVHGPGRRRRRATQTAQLVASNLFGKAGAE
jgi:hypothetical protein